MASKTIKTIQFDKWNNKKGWKRALIIILYHFYLINSILIDFIAPFLNLMPCLSSWLEIIACLHSRSMREAKSAVISRREDKQGIQLIFVIIWGIHTLKKIVPLLVLRAKLVLRLTMSFLFRRTWRLRGKLGRPTTLWWTRWILGS